jgi:hypothetical protein
MKTVLIFTLCTLLGGIALSQKPCSQAELLRAEKEAATLRTWDALYKSYRLYGHCDDVDAGEGYSESVARILVDHWETLNRLSQLARKDQWFRRLAIGGVNATDDMRDVRKIRENAAKRCPPDLHELCKDLRIQADAAIREDASVERKK